MRDVDRVYRKCSIHWIADYTELVLVHDYEGIEVVSGPRSLYTISHPYYGRITDYVYDELHHLDSDEVKFYGTEANCIDLQVVQFKKLIERYWL